MPQTRVPPTLRRFVSQRLAEMVLPTAFITAGDGTPTIFLVFSSDPFGHAGTSMTAKHRVTARGISSQCGNFKPSLQGTMLNKLFGRGR